MRDDGLDPGYHDDGKHKYFVGFYDYEIEEEVEDAVATLDRWIEYARFMNFPWEVVFSRWLAQ